MQNRSSMPLVRPLQVRRSTLSALWSPLLISLALFGLALLPRLLDLGRFLTADEFLWVDRSRNFLAGLTNPAYQCTTVVEKWDVAEGLACTLRTGHPGVTTMWTGSFGFLLRWLADGRSGSLHDYVVAVSTNPLDPTFVAPERLGTVLLMALWVVAVYWLARCLFGTWVALLGASLIALNPFHVAYSRVIHHDALSTAFITLSVLTAFIYWGEQRGRRWLVLSGLLAGLAFLSKLASLFLLPFIALIGLWFFFANRPQPGTNRGSTLALLVLDGLLWFAVSLAAVFVLWPAMWVAPLEAVDTAYSLGFKYSTGGHAKGNFLLGRVSQDPGALFYPVTWLYRTSPLVMAGLVAAAVTWLLALKRRPGASAGNGLRGEGSRQIHGDSSAGGSARLALPTKVRAPFSATGDEPSVREHSPSSERVDIFRYVPLLLLFTLGYFIMLTISEKKQERYFLPVYPWLDLIAAIGFVALARWSRFAAHASRNRPLAKRRTPGPFIPILLLIVLLNGYFVAASYPYYFTYYNPLLGGIKSAAQAITIGWGEGLDQAAAYLNQQADPAHTRVASWYESTFAPYYHGPSISYSKEKGKVLAGDYVIFYINQMQRRYPDDIMFDYFESRFQPAQTISLHGLDYAWIYPSLGVDHYIQDQVYTGIASLLAWQWREGDGPLLPGRPAEFELYWEYLGKRPEEFFFFRLVDGHGGVWAEGQSLPVAGENPPLARWRDGEIILERGALTPPRDMPPGRYLLQIGFYTDAPAVKAGELLFETPEDEALIRIGHAGRGAAIYTLPPAARPVNRALGDALTLLGASWPQAPLSRSPEPEPEPLNSSAFPIDLYWRVERSLPADASLHVGLMDPAGEARQAWFDLSLAETIQPDRTTWQPGDIIHTRWQLDLLPEVPAGSYRLELVWPEDTDVSLEFGRVVVGE